jgi:DNA-binding MarR family transcriptional regulator
MKDSIRLLRQGAKIQYRIRANDKKPRPFGTDQLLYQSEIHFIDAIGPGEGLNASQLSKKLGITNGAVTQVADKLVRKKLIERYKIQVNKKAVYLRLTTAGKIAFENHKLFHQELSDRMIEYLDGLTKEQMDALFGLMDIVDQHLPDLDKENGE